VGGLRNQSTPFQLVEDRRTHGTDLPLPSMPMLLQIRGYHLPGRVWQSSDENYNNVHVGVQVGKEPRELVRGDAESSSWTIPIEVVVREGGLDFRGAAVQGRPGARFV